MSKVQGPHQAADEPVAKVLAMVALGHSATEAAEVVSREVGVSIPARTAQRWVQRARGLADGNKPILDKWTRRVDQALDLIQDGLDVIEGDETRALALKNLLTLNIIAGTGTDKVLKANDPPQPNNLTQVVVVLNATSREDVEARVQDYIEGQVNDAGKERTE